MIDMGKRLEDNYKSSCRKCKIFNYRLYDTGANRTGVANVCDFITFRAPNLLLCECKATKEKSFPWSNISDKQWTMNGYIEDHVYAGFLIHFYSYGKLYFLPVQTALDLRYNVSDRKSVSIIQLEQLCEENKAVAVDYLQPRVNLDINVDTIFDWLEDFKNEHYRG